MSGSDISPGPARHPGLWKPHPTGAWCFTAHIRDAVCYCLLLILGPPTLPVLRTEADPSARKRKELLRAQGVGCSRCGNSA